MSDLGKRIERLVAAYKDSQEALGKALLDLPIDKIASLLDAHEAAQDCFLYLVTWSGAERGGGGPGEPEGWHSARPDCAWGCAVLAAADDDVEADLVVRAVDLIS